MYPTLSDFLNDVFGISLPLPIQSFGFFLAIAFLFAAIIVSYELKRKEKQGIIAPLNKIKTIGKPISIIKLALTALIAFSISYKLVEAVLNYPIFIENPAHFILSTKGNLIGAIIISIIVVFIRYIIINNKKLKEPIILNYQVHPYEHTVNIILIGALTGIIGSKLFHNLEHIDELFNNPIEALISFNGLNFYGGLILATIAIIIYSKINKIPVPVMADVVAPAIILAYGIGRIGCQFAGDGDWGIENLASKPEWLNIMPDWLWSYNYPHNILNQGIHIDGCTGKHCFVLATPVFPTPIYETIICFFIFLFLWLIRKKINTNGVLFGLFLILGGTERFFIEKIRINIHYFFLNLYLSQAEIISVLLIITGFILIWKLKRQKK